MISSLHLSNSASSFSSSELMAHSSIFLFFLILTIALTSCYANKLGLDFHHRFSDKVREWTDSQGLPPVWKPEEAPHGTVEYYRALLKHDLNRHRGRSLASGEQFDFANGNKTTEYLGFLHYAFVDLGTPKQTFFVALDTGSDLFWVPCHCKNCAPTSDPSYQNMMFSNYVPSASTTSKMISCSSDQCFTNSTTQCTNKTASCTYIMEYGFGYTSSSGILVQDDLHLIARHISSNLVKLPIVFGCGEVQTGDLLNGVAPNGLMGLGMSNISVPSIIASHGITSDSFSMCFGTDGYGRLNFGDSGSADQYETSLNTNPYGFYNISITEVTVGSTISELSFTAIVDSGTTYSGFTSTVYGWLVTSFDAQVSEPSIYISGCPFDYCYEISPTQNEVQVPSIYFTTEGGSSFQALYPIVFISEQNSKRPFSYCLAIVRYDFNIIGENFLVGQRIVFNREKEVLGWKPYNCSTDENTFAPAPAPAPSSPYSPVIPVPTDSNRASTCSVGAATIICVVASLILVTHMGLSFY
ncbi:Eukaryotic aspartyl protease family protein [Rhynchospora pubera]|uniref:Eukaryotic aspartyl protease family protein n=1 Tax=Rhynchospora pubera TaxID=906938 RepID=A0AAV8E7F4_9POAL|nr:Eukaryotic aspartyl protease family protein [Rhynchospora pubera]